MPGGNQLPFTQVPPPSAVNGSDVRQPPPVADGGGVIPGGSQPLLTHVPPPSAVNGSEVIHPDSRASDPPLRVDVPTATLLAPLLTSHSGAPARLAT